MTTPEAEDSTAPAKRASSPLGRVWRIARFLVALFLFIGALQLMKTGASGLEILHEQGLLVRNALATLGLGWLGALLFLSGSPVAAISLSLVKAGEDAAASGATSYFTETQGFTMLTGSRLGAAFVVLVVAVLYALRGGAGERVKPVSTAVLALSTTALIYVPAMFIGLAILRWEPFHNLKLTFPNQFKDLIDLIYGGLLDRVEAWNSVLVFLMGVGVLLLSFKLIDTVLPSFDPDTFDERRTCLLRSKWPMFGLGSLVALITMSVSVALTVLVPLVAKKYVKREDILPYIMGANITTLGDTMLAAFALDSPGAVRIVIAEVIATSLISVVVLAFFYPQTRRVVWKFQRQMVKSKPRLAMFTAGLFALPLTLIAIAGQIG